MSDCGVGGVGGDEYNLLGNDVEEISGGETSGSGNTDDSIGGEWREWVGAGGGDGGHEGVDRWPWRQT